MAKRTVGYYYTHLLFAKTAANANATKEK